jgi:hypothetical protein
MKKRTSTILLTAIALICLLMSTASASSPCDGNIQSRYARLSEFRGKLSISTSGLADCYGRADLLYITDSVVLTMDLQRSTNGVTWTSYKTWSTSGSSSVELEKYCCVTSGYYYQVAATAKVYDSAGSLTETSSTTSNIVKY